MSCGTKGLSLQMMSVADTFTVDFLQNFEDRKYVDAFLDEAKKIGLKTEYSESTKYRTPKDHTKNTNFMISLVSTLKRLFR